MTPRDRSVRESDEGSDAQSLASLEEGADPGEENEDDLLNSSVGGSAVVTDSDWTTETLLNQLRRGNIDLNPSFQRRDAWNLQRKSRFVESLILDLPVPQIVLAERREQRGTYLVIDGKQRLLTLAQYAGYGDSRNTGFRLRGLVVRQDLNRVHFEELAANPAYVEELSQFENSTIRTVIIRNWPNEEFLYLVFLRLNTGSVALSPQELRQALHPGPFVSFIDEFSFSSEQLRAALGLSQPDFRMRDAELATRFFGFQYFLSDYAGDLRRFLDSTCLKLNDRWKEDEVEIRNTASSLEASIGTTRAIFGTHAFRRFVGADRYERPFNRAVFDVMTFHFADPEVARSAEERGEAVKAAFEDLSTRNTRFSDATAATTKSLDSTFTRLKAWTDTLAGIIDTDLGDVRLENNRIRVVK
ncbi:MAG TPA: DUF262 domain-containing protein [Propionicimonas sp.]|jgi:hypothetical protein